mgnify:CR=1 FL=1
MTETKIIVRSIDRSIDQSIDLFIFQGNKIHKEIRFKPPILAYDSDLEINTPVKYSITTGNDKGYFYIDPVNGTLFLEKEIDLEKESLLIGNTFNLQIQASQVRSLTN